ncbi:MAG: PASTA domain-containing protein, partial [Clostridia bacterium]|nr:PASTA domain-containing protein [Clostridia bacterium]
VRNILEGVVSKNTGKNAYIKGFRVAGKTGTSEKTPRGNGKYVASFIGFAPCNDPEIIGLVMLDEPMGSSHMGGAIAAPTFKNIFDNVLRYMNVEPQYTEEELNSLDNTVPNVEGLEKAEAIKQFANTGLKYNIIGSGSTITSQIPKGGSALPDGSTVVLYTEDTASQQVEVPNLLGMTASQANTALTNAGLNIKEVNTSGDASTGTAVVNKQEPAAGTMVNRGTVVNVQFSYTDNVH